MKTLALSDIIGPIMVGPSSSHTAGALRIARMARGLVGTAPMRVSFTLYGSFAHTGSGHGTDKALVAGILGLAADDLGIRDSFRRAEEAGIDISFIYDLETPVDHPNTVDVHIEDSTGNTLDVRGVSIGGGAASIRRIDGIDVDITGEHTSIVVRQRDVTGVLAHIAGCLSDESVNIATTRVYRMRRGSVAYTVMEVDGDVPTEIKAAIEGHSAVYDVRIIPADNVASGQGPVAIEMPDVPRSVTPDPPGTPRSSARASTVLTSVGEDADEAFVSGDFISGTQLLDLCEREGKSIADVFLAREEALAARDAREEDTRAYLDRVLEVMRTAATDPLDHPTPSMSGLIGGEASAVARSCQPVGALVDSLCAHATTYALAVLETNASMGRIVAAPTAGSSGVLPAVLLALEQDRGFDVDTLCQGILSAAAVGYLISRNSTVSGAEGGCQAEIGSAAAMAATAAVEMAGGTPSQALDAAANALASHMGLVCDPIAGLVEVPCQKRNATAAVSALVSAQIALAGVHNLVGFDETVAAMDAVGRSLPFELRESALGGIAATPSACAWCVGRG